MGKPWQGSKIKGLGTGKRQAQTAWIEYSFNDLKRTVQIRIYRYSWIVWTKDCPLNEFPKTRNAAIRWCKEWRFQYIRERVSMAPCPYILKYQDGNAANAQEGGR